MQYWAALIALLKQENTDKIAFDYKKLRFWIGLIALLLPIAVWVAAAAPLGSVSMSYHTPARDIFVGALAVVGAFLLAYKGHQVFEAGLARVAGVCALLVALAPTKCVDIYGSNFCDPDGVANQYELHIGAAIAFFVILTLFCWGPFRWRAMTKVGLADGHKAKIRIRIYFWCGLIMLASMLVMAASLQWPCLFDHKQVVFFGESVALFAFGIAWITAGHYIGAITTQGESWNMFAKPPA